MHCTLPRSSYIFAFAVVVGFSTVDVRLADAQVDSVQPVDETPLSPTPERPEPSDPAFAELPAPAIGSAWMDDEAAGRTADLGYQALLNGPVHEAFAMPGDSNPGAGVRVIGKQPPPVVDEQPPETRSDDKGMNWIPGYWSWSDDSDDYVWVSGLWRKVPPGRSWNPGFWSATSTGYRWTTGYWAQPQALPASANYLPAPPSSIDNGPSVAPPTDDYFWVPGHWEFAADDYRWRSGFWSEQQNDWVWQPACYVYTPQGFVMVDGYWDYLPSARGQLYAPVSFYNSAYLQPNYVYQPRYPLANAASLLLNLFVRRGYSNYFYGNYFGPSNAALGYQPWYGAGFGNRYGNSFGNGLGNGFASPWLGYYDWKYRKSGINFVGSMQRYENQARANSNFASSQQSGGNKHSFTTGNSSGGASGSGSKHGGSGRSMDDVVRSDSSRVDFQRNEKGFKGNGKTSQGFSDLNLRSFSSGGSPSMGKSDNSQSSPHFSGNRDFSPSVSKGGNSKHDTSPSQSSSRGSSPSFQRSESQSFSRGHGSSSSSGKGNSGGGSKSNSGGSKGQGKGKK